jgi:hypothetical protein
MSEFLHLIDDKQVFEASYDTIDSRYNEYWLDNPLVEALPPILSEAEFFTLTENLPPFSSEIRKLDKQQRIAHLDQIMRLNVPTASHLFLKQRFDRIIRDGYGSRNPIKNLHFLGLQKKLKLAKNLTRYALGNPPDPTSPGFSIIGIGGVGKTHGLDTVLGTYPQVIVHKNYTDRHGVVHQLQRPQIVYLKITCPPDGTLKALCDSFFQAVDALLGTTYHEDFGTKSSKRRTAAQMVPSMALVASLVSLGVLVVDEIQYLSKQKSGGAELMLHFFGYLMDLIKVPVVLVGTPKANAILNAAFWQMRRNAGQGHFEWLHILRNKNPSTKCPWERFLANVWKYQYCKESIPLVGDLVPKDFSDKLYLESYGIIDFALKLFRLTQERAINKKIEVLTVELIEEVAKDLFGNMRKIVAAIMSDTPPKGLTIDDVKFKIEQQVQNGFEQNSKIDPTQGANEFSAAQRKLKSKTQQDSKLAKPLLECFDVAILDQKDVIRSMRDSGFVKSARTFGGLSI